MLPRWFRDQGIVNAGRVTLVPVKGRARTFDIRDDLVRTRRARTLREEDCEIFVLDCLTPLLNALGLDESNEGVGAFISAFDAFLDEAKIAEALILHHMGHHGERSRGASRLRVYPDAEWKLVRERPEDPNAEPDSSAPRYFSAYGRDVDIPERLLVYDEASRRLPQGEGSRKTAPVGRARLDVMRFLGINPGASKNQIETSLLDTTKNARSVIRSALESLVVDGIVNTHPGAKNSTMHYLTAT